MVVVEVDVQGLMVLGRYNTMCFALSTIETTIETLL